MRAKLAALAGATWRKSSYSGPNGGDCVEVAMTADLVGVRDSKDPDWRKSSYSGPNGGECVEVAMAAETPGVRDSKNSAGQALAFGTQAWTAFLAHLR